MLYSVHLKRLFIFISLVFFLALQASAENLAQLNETSFSLNLSSTDNAKKERVYTFEFSAPNGQTPFANKQNASAFILTHPTRLVLDVKGITGSPNNSIQVRDSLVSAIRIGTHDDKTRIVIDLRSETEPGYTLEKSNNGQTISLRFSANAQQASAKNSAPLTTNITGDEPLPTPAARHETYSADTAGNITVSSSTDENDKNELAENYPPKKINDKRKELSAVTFKAIGIPPRGGILFELKSVGTYSLQQEKTNLYKLVLENTKITTNSLLLPQYAPANVEGLQVVLLQEDGNNVIVKIYVQDNIPLSPYVINGKLWIKVSN